MLGVRVGCEAYLVVERSAQLDRTTALLMPDLLKFGHGRQADVVVVVIKGFLLHCPTRKRDTAMKKNL